MHSFLVALVVVTSLPMSVPPGSDEKMPDHTVLVSGEDREMNEAIAKAQASLDGFLRLKANPPKGAAGFKLKLKVTDGNGSEHLWITPFHATAKGFAGTVSNAPEYVESVTEGEEVEFRREDISDWGYELNGKQKGSYTVCVLFKHMDKEEVDVYRRDYGFEC
ncbi:YegJ family protein [Dokdonella sp.]|uniref:YegJ family protein n=1 Tax=Dokdonella sp. TaxID=2291710 RepID=UPI00378341BB